MTMVEMAGNAGTGLCTATYDEPRRADRGDTHTCSLGDGHDGLHLCDLCGTHWMARTGVRLPAGAEREQVQLARQDAMVTGTGFVMITQDADGFHYERVEPDRVLVKAAKTAKTASAKTAATTTTTTTKSTDLGQQPGRGTAHADRNGEPRRG